MCLTVNGERARAANAFATIGVEGDRFFATPEQIFIYDVEHLQKRSVRRNIVRFILDELAARFRVLLSPDAKFEIHFKRCCETDWGAHAAGVSVSAAGRDN
jgi:hypothetical protein